MRRSLVAVSGAILATIALAACAGPNDDPTGGLTPSGASPSTSPSASTSEPAASPSASDGASADGTCATDAVQVTQQTGDAGAGSVTVTFAFENVGTVACTLAGFPGVSAVGDGDGTQIGEPADRSDESFVPVELAPGATATAAMRMVSIATGGGALGPECQAVAADGWRVYPPDSTEAILVEVGGLTACSADVDWITIGPIVAG